MAGPLTRAESYTMILGGNEIIHVDAGYHIVGMKNPEAPDITVAQNGD